MSPIQPILKQLREAEFKATKGEWRLTVEPFGDGQNNDLDDETCYRVESGGDNICDNYRWYPAAVQKDNQALIVLMRNNLIPLLDYVESIQDKAQKYDKLCRQYPLMHSDRSPYGQSTRERVV